MEREVANQNIKIKVFFYFRIINASQQIRCNYFTHKHTSLHIYILE